MWVLDINMRGPGNKKQAPKNWLPKDWLPKNWAFSAIPIYWECNGVLGYSDLLGMQWRSRLLGVPMSGRSDEWVFWISTNTRDFWLNGLRRKSILENDPTFVLGK